MSIIRTQAESRACRSRLDICYLCGESLRDRGNTSAEHIVPKAILGSSPSMNAWAVVLDVHQTCECSKKRPLDEVYALFQKISLSAEKRMDISLDAMYKVIDAAAHSQTDERTRTAFLRFCCDVTQAAVADDFPTSAQHACYRLLDAVGTSKDEVIRAKTTILQLFNPPECLNSGHYRKTTLKPATDVKLDGLNLPPDGIPLDGFRDIMSAVWNWVRGFNAMIYGEYLPDTTDHNLWTPDIRSFRGTSSPKEITPDSRDCDTIEHLLHVAELTNKADGVQFWRETCVFRCAWLYFPEHMSYARCLWCINIPPHSQDIKVWYGWYNTPRPPERARVLD